MGRVIHPTQTRRVFWLKAGIGAACIAAVSVAARKLGFPSCGALESYLVSHGALGPILFAGVVAVATVLFVPGTLLGVTAGVIFGAGLGSALVFGGALAGAVTAFVIARYLARPLVADLLSRRSWYKRFQARFQANRFSYLLFLRLSPIFPFNGLNYACGLLPIGFRDYLVSTAVGILPGTVVYVGAGRALGCAMLDGGAALSPQSRWGIVLAFTGLSLLSLVPVIHDVRKRRARSGDAGRKTAKTPAGRRM